MKSAYVCRSLQHNSRIACFDTSENRFRRRDCIRLYSFLYIAYCTCSVVPRLLRRSTIVVGFDFGSLVCCYLDPDYQAVGFDPVQANRQSSGYWDSDYRCCYWAIAPGCQAVDFDFAACWFVVGQVFGRYRCLTIETGSRQTVGYCQTAHLDLSAFRIRQTDLPLRWSGTFVVLHLTDDGCWSVSWFFPMIHRRCHFCWTVPLVDRESQDITHFSIFH